jgi:DEAD/DEAH box helicase domain-containing protein
MSLKRVVFDIETKNIFSDVGQNNPAALDISVVGAYDSESSSYRAFIEEEFGDLWRIIERADILIGFNSDHFDIPLLNKYYPGDLTKIKSLDILSEIKNSFGRRMKLDQIAEGTLGRNKTAHGLMATEWWKKGEYQKVKDYCLQDVKITKEIYDYAIANNKLFFKEGGKNIEIPLDTSNWEKIEKNSITHTLPF